MTAKILHGDNENSDQTDCTYAQAKLRASKAHVNRYVFSRCDSCYPLLMYVTAPKTINNT